jgi:hypothetical protein
MSPLTPTEWTSAKCISELQRRTDTVLLSFSRGKDSIAAWLAIRPHFKRIIPFYCYRVPGLGFVERSLKYYEEFFECKIWQLPHPSTYHQLRNLMFQPPENCAIIEAAELEKFSYEDLEQSVRIDLNLGPEVFVATGVRSADSQRRALALHRFGPISERKKKFHPVFDWNKDQVIDVMERAGVQLPVDYLMFGRSFDGINAQFLEPLKRFFPEDYAKVLRLFPMAELELLRWQFAREAA